MWRSILILCLFIIISYQHCLGRDNQTKDWWVQLLFPKSIADGYGYMDNSSTSPQFQIHKQKGDTNTSALYKTLTQINTLKYQIIAWNDQWPTGQTSSSKAHSKGIIAFDSQYQKGFYLGHSIPKYPAFNKGIINISINNNQSINGQSIICITYDKYLLKDHLNKILPMRPDIYYRNISNQLFYQTIVTDHLVTQPDYQSLFGFKQYQIGRSNFSFIFKNGGINGSIFQDGLNKMFASSIVAETWGRPLQNSWCVKPNPVMNIHSVIFNKQTTWNETKDHSKWAYPILENYGCIGDMNRMSSQWKRGGAFYCIQSNLLKSALVAISGKIDICK